MTVRSLADALRGWDDDALERLLVHRPDLLAPVPADLGQLAARAATAPSVARCLDNVDRWTLTVLEAVCVATEPAAASYSRVRAMLPDASDEAVRDRLDALLARALVWGDDDALEVPGGVREVVGHRAAGLGTTLRVLLAGLSATKLRGMAADLGLPEPLDSSAAIDAIVAALTDPGTVDALLATAPDGARDLLEQLVWGPPAGNVLRADRDVRRATAQTPGDWLLAHGLLMSTGASTVVLPREVALLLRGGRLYRAVQTESPVPTVVAKRDKDTVDHASAERAAAFVRHTGILLEAWGLDGPAVLRSGGLGVRELRRSAAVMHVDEREAALVAEVARAAGLLATGDDEPQRWLPTQLYDAWRGAETADRWASLAQAWIDSDRVTGLVGTRDDHDRVQLALGPGIERTIAVEVRRQVLDLLAEVSDGEVLDADGIEAVLSFRQPRRPTALRREIVESTIGEAELLGVTGAGALGSAGRALIATGSEAAADALGRWLPTPVRHVLLQGDLTAIAPGPLVSELAEELALMAEVESTGAATVYRFNEPSVRRALDAGRTAADLHELLATVSTTPVPQALDYLIDDMARRHGQIRVGAISSYVRCDAPGILNELLADRRAQILGLRRLAPTVLGSSIPPDRLLEVLRDIGLVPAAESADGAVLVHRPDARRAQARLATMGDPRGGGAARSFTVLRLPTPTPALVNAAVRALRAGERAAGPRGPVVAGMAGGTESVAVPREAATATLDHLRAALGEGRPVWIGYVDAHGATSQRVVEPVRLDGGFLTAYDHRRDAVRTFAVHRITGVADIDEEAPA